jgi:hypothetical protein
MEEILKESVVHYRGSGTPYISSAYGYLRLTKDKLSLNYYIIGIPGVNKIFGLFCRKIEIPTKNISEASYGIFRGSGIITISYFKDSRIRKIYVAPWIAFSSPSERIKICDEWVDGINKLKMPFGTQGLEGKQSTHDKDNSGAFLFFLIILTVMVVGGFVGYKRSLQRVYHPSEIENIAKDKTANWKTYRNNDYGFEVKYPSEWIIMKDSTESIIFADKKETETQKEKQAGEIRCSAGIWLYNNEKGLSLRDWAVGKWGEPEKREAGKISEVKINDLEGIKYEFMNMGTETNVLFSKDSKVIDIQTTFDGCDNLNTIFTQILSTFKFIEPKTETTDWKTYRNEEQGIEFTYPKEWGVLTAKSQKNQIYILTSENEKIKTVLYHKPSNILAFIERGEKYSAGPYNEEVYQDILKFVFLNKEIKTLYTVSSDLTKEFAGINDISISPNGKYIYSFYTNQGINNIPLVINIDTGKNILESFNINYFWEKDILWSSGSEVLAIINDKLDDMRGVGECGLYVSDYGNPEKLNYVFSATFEECFQGKAVTKIEFLDNERLAFETGGGVGKYIYNAKTKELTKIK